MQIAEAFIVFDKIHVFFVGFFLLLLLFHQLPVTAGWTEAVCDEKFDT